MQRSVRRSLVLLFVLLLLLLSAAVPGGLAEGDDLEVTDDPGDDPALQRKTKKKSKSNRKKDQSGKNETERPKADARAKWDKSGDGSDGKDYWGMNNPNPGWDKYYAGKCDKFLQCAAAGDLVCLEKDAIPLCNLQLQETQGDINVWAQGLGIAAKEGQLAVVKLLVKFATKWWNQDMVVNEAGETVLMHAAAHGQYEIVDWLVHEGADTRTLSPNGETAYDMARTSEAPGETLAAMERMAEMATNKLLDKLASGLAFAEKDYVRVVKAGAHTNRVHNATGLTAIALGAKFGMAEMVKQLAGAGADVNWRDEEKTGHTVLHMACDRGHFGVVQTLLEEGADPAATTRHFEMDCLQLATMNGRNGIAQLMLDHGKAYPERRADAKHTNFEGEDALLMFARQMYGRTAQQTGMVAALVDAGADVNLRSAVKGCTALYYLIDHAQDAAMQLLIEKGADVKDVARESGGEGEDGLEVELKVGAFEQSIRSGCRPCATWLIANGHREAFKFTKSRGGQEGMTGLYSVVMHNWMDVLAALIKDGADTNEGNRDNSTPLFAAALRGSAEAVGILIEGGARVGHANRLGESALFIAAQGGKLDAIKALVKGGANVDQRSSDKTTALFRAAKNGHGRCVLELLRLGADKTIEGFSKTKAGEGGGQAGMASMMTAAQLADKSGYPDIAKVIRDWQDIDKDL